MEDRAERSIVISFAEEDKPYVLGFQKSLNQELQTYRWVDAPESESSLTPYVWTYLDQPGGNHIRREIKKRRIRVAAAIIFVLTEHSGLSNWITDEIEWTGDAGKDDVRIVVALGDHNTLVNTPNGDDLKSITWIYPKELPQRHSNVIEAVIESLEKKRVIEKVVLFKDVRLGKRITRKSYGGIHEGVLTKNNIDVIVKEVSSTDKDVLRELDDRVAQRRRISHLMVPNIIDYLQYGERRYVVMEEIPGRSLAELTAARPLRWEELQPWAESVLTTLDALHQQGVYHLGIKPQNLKQHQGQIKLLDIGFDRQPEGMRGTPDPYLASEQLSNASADARTDIFAVGATLYTALTQDTQPNANTVLVHRLMRDVPEPVRSAIHRAMNPDPAKRFQSAYEMRQALQKKDPGPDWRRWMVAAVGLVAVIAVALLVLTDNPVRSAFLGLTPVPTMPPTIQTTPPDPSAVQPTTPPQAGNPSAGPPPPTPMSSPEVPKPLPVADLLPALKVPQVEGNRVYRIVVPIPLSGEFQERAQGMELARQMFVDHWTTGRLQSFADDLKDLGIELQFDVVDDKGNADIPVQLAQEIVGTDTTRCLAGHYRSLSTIAAAEEYKRANYPLLIVNSTSTNTEVTNIIDTLWRIISTDAQQGSRAHAVAEELRTSNGAIALVRTEDMEDPFTNGVVAAFNTANTAAGGNTPFSNPPATFPIGAESAEDFQAAAETIKSIQPLPGLIFFIGTNNQLEKLLGQLPDKYKEVPILGVSLMDNIDAVQQLRQDGWTITYTSVGVPKDEGFALMARWFVADFEQKGKGVPLGAYAAETYDAIYLCTQAIKQAAKDQQSNNLSAKNVSDTMPAVFASTFPKTEDRNDTQGTAAGPYIMDKPERELSEWLIVVRRQDEGTGEGKAEVDFCDADSCSQYRSITDEPEP